MTNPPTTPRSRSSVANALRILLLLRQRPELRVTDVADALGVAPSTAHRLLTELRHLGFLRQADGTRRYTVGYALTELAAELEPVPRLEEMARPHLEQLCREVDETVNLQRLSGAEVCFLTSAQTERALRVVRPTGSRSPAHASAGGKVLLAALDVDEVRALVGGQLQPRTPRTTVDVNQLEAELREIRVQGFATNLEENTVGVNAIAVPLANQQDGSLVALSVAAPTIRMPERALLELIPPMRDTVRAIVGDYIGTSR